MAKAISAAREWSNAQTQEIPNEGRAAPERNMIPVDFVLNSDAAWQNGSRTAGLAWVLRRKEGFREFTSSYRHVNSATVAEGLASRKALVKCKDK